jgi:hypothetical protein
MEFFFQLILTASFLVVSIAFAAKLVVDAYLEWVQVMTGIQVMTKRDQEEELARQQEEEEPYE